MLVSSAVFSALNRDNVRKTVRGPHFGGGVQVVVPLLPEEKACASLVRFVAFDKKGAFTKWTTNLGSLGLLVHVHGETREEENVHRGTYIERESKTCSIARETRQYFQENMCAFSWHTRTYVYVAYVLFSVTVGGMVRGASQGCIGAEDEQQLREEGGMGFAEDMKGMRADAILVHSSHRRGGGTARVARGGGGGGGMGALRSPPA